MKHLMTKLTMANLWMLSIEASFKTLSANNKRATATMALTSKDKMFSVLTVWDISETVGEPEDLAWVSLPPQCRFVQAAHSVVPMIMQLLLDS